MKKVIVTGANGFVGRYLLRELKKRCYNIIAIVKDQNEDIDCIKDLGVSIVYCGLKEIQSLSKVIKQDDYDCFYHLAWAGSSGDGRQDYELQLLNAKYCVDAASIAAKLGCKRFVGAGSVTQLMYEDYIKQDGSTPEMVSCYAVGKIAAEYLTKCICVETGIDFLWAYISNFYGAEDSTQNFVNFLIENYVNENVPILTSGDQKADFMYVSDVARALVMMAESGKKNSSYYVGYGTPRPLKEFVKIIRDIINPNLDTGLNRKSFNGFDIDFEKINYKKLSEETGFKPQVSFEEGIKLLIQWKNGRKK